MLIRYVLELSIVMEKLYENVLQNTQVADMKSCVYFDLILFQILIQCRQYNLLSTISSIYLPLSRI